MTPDQKELVECMKEGCKLYKINTMWVCEKNNLSYYPHHRTIKSLLNRNILKYKDNEHLILNEEFEGTWIK